MCELGGFFTDCTGIVSCFLNRVVVHFLFIFIFYHERVNMIIACTIVFNAGVMEFVGLGS